MEKQHRFILTSNKAPKLTCPHCSAKKHWQRYLDTHTGELLPDHYGRCDNADKCGAWNDPHKDGFTKAIWEREKGNLDSLPDCSYYRPVKRVETPPAAYIPPEALNATLQGYGGNSFIQNLLCNVPFPFEAQGVEKVIALYYLGTISEGYMKGAVTFPYIDADGNIRAVQVKNFDPANHTTGTSSLPYLIEQQHTTAGQPLPDWLQAYRLQGKSFSCLFGEHLLNRYPLNPVALVEAPKTAIYGTLYFGAPDDAANLLWLAVYNKSAFTYERVKALQGRSIIVFPDLSKDGSTYEEWSAKAKDFEKRLPGTSFIISDLIERYAPAADRTAGNDLADYLIKQDWKAYRNSSIQQQPPDNRTPIKEAETQANHSPMEPGQMLVNVSAVKPSPVAENLIKLDIETPPAAEPMLSNVIISAAPPLMQAWATPSLANLKPKRESWDDEIVKLETFFESATIPAGPVKLDAGSIITDIQTFINGHLATVKQQDGKRTYRPYLERLKTLQTILTNGQQTAADTL